VIFLTASCTPLRGDTHPEALTKTGYVLSSPAAQTQPAIWTLSPKPTQSHTLTPAVVPATNTQTSVPPTEITTLTPTFILSRIETACMEPGVELPAAGEISGRLYFSTITSDAISKIIDFSRESSLAVPAEMDTNLYAFSPDRSWVAVDGPHNGNKRNYTLVVFHSDLSQKIVPDPTLPTLLDAYWINNQWLALTKPDLEHWIHSTIFINPFTGERREFLPDFPDLYFDPWSYRMWPSLAFFSPTFEHLVYIGDDAPLAKLVLLENGTQRKIQEIPQIEYTMEHPLWLSTGDQVIFIKANPRHEAWQDDLYRMYIDGRVQKITSLSDQYERVRIGFYSLSPDEKQLAFWLDTNDNQEYPTNGAEIAILDLETHQITRTCVYRYDPVYRPPVWSPDGRYLAVGGKESDADDAPLRTHIIDLVEQKVYDFGENLQPVGWLRDP
jgi:WD40 repeat protein